ncbi:MAG: TonB-dependent receptor [Saprospiraceae bacterium]|nr:TonB-dependent receptor [Saprospiraceae bacterium]MCB9318964.1 TonB-dependent receptor [Lewinellaceae bacterium]
MKKLGYIAWCLMLPILLSAQAIIKGGVYDKSNGDPLIGANIIIKGTSTGTTADYDGSFELKVDAIPVTLTISYTGYESLDLEITELMDKFTIELEETSLTMATVEVRGQRISDKQKASPLTVESMDLLAIKQTPADNFYDGLGSLKGVDLTAASLGFKIINTRGFNSTSPVRSLQIIDGVDNQAPGLNFSLGNFLGTSDLDVLKVDLIQGASSAFYGPNAFNGVISMTTKDPFYQKGLSASVKGGERALFEGAIRWADAIKNGAGKDVFGYKFNFFYLRADDWLANNYDPISNSISTTDNPGRYDAVNIYGDEYQAGMDLSTAPPWRFPGLGVWYRTGYREEDLVDYNTRNIKANAALHWRLQPQKEAESPELIMSGNFGNGTTVYQGDNRFSLKNILFFQGRLELRKRDKYFIRAYFTEDDAGDSYDPYFTALRLQDRAKNNFDWASDYILFYRNNFEKKANELGYPKLQTIINPDGTFSFAFDQAAADAWLTQYHDTLVTWHSRSENYANTKNPALPTANGNFLRPGTPEFEEAFREITTSLSNTEEGGTRFYDRSALYHIHGEYDFTPTWVDKWVVGANARLYTPQSKGTIFYDTANVKITNFEYGIYTGAEKRWNDNTWTLSATIRMDKNQNFDYLFSPAASIVYKPRANNYLRISFSSAIRNPTLTDQYLNLDVGRATLAGNLNGVENLITLNSFSEYRKKLDLNELVYFNIDPVRPEKVKTAEFGYRTTLWNKVYLDAGYYYSIYNDFLGFNIGLDAQFDPNSGLPSRIEAYRYAANSTNQVTTQGANIGMNYYFSNYFAINGNYSWNRLNKTFEDDPIIPAFNTPEHKYNIGFSGRDVIWKIGNGSLKNFGFNINYKWIQGFVFEGSPQFTGIIPSYDLLDAQVNWSIPKQDLTIKVGASNLLNNKQFQTYGGPRIGRLAYISFLYENKKN